MPSLIVSQPHQLGQAAALARLKTFLSELHAMHAERLANLDHRWDEHRLGFSLATLGMSFKGEMEVGEDQVQVDLQLPFAAMLFKGKIEQEIRGQLAKVLA